MEQLENKSAIVAVDSFKGCMSSPEAGQAVKDALVYAGMKEENIHVFPVTDGGEGFCKVISASVKGHKIKLNVHAPLGNVIPSGYFISDDGVAYIESAAASGYGMVSGHDRNPLKTSSYGLGEMIRDAAERHIRGIVVGMGGTATCDGGVGMLQALGVKFLLADGQALGDGEPAMMKEIVRMDSGVLEGFRIPIEAWSDTSAVFHGENGAVEMYGKQKGITDEMKPDAEKWMSRMAGIYGKASCRDGGAGAAGGIGGALHAVMGASVLSGARQIISLARMEDLLRSGMDMVITGEGRYDRQTLTGKIPACIGEAARKAGVGKIVCLCGSMEIEDRGPFDIIVPITPAGQPLSEALKPSVAVGNIKDAVTHMLTY